MKLLVVTTSFPLDAADPSGIFVQRMVQSLPRDIAVTVLAPAAGVAVEPASAAPGYALRTFRYAPRRWRRLAQGPGGIPAALKASPWLWLLVPGFVAALFWACLREGRRADMIHAQWLPTGVIAGLSGLCLGKPVITTIRGSDGKRWERSALARGLLRLAARLNRRLVTVSHALRERAHRHGGGTVDVIPNGVDRPPPPAQPRSACELLCIANLIEGKGVDCVLHALAGGIPASWTLTVVGDGPHRDALLALAERLGVLPRCRFVGRVAPEEAWEHLGRATALVLASRSEGRPNVVLEAMAAGLPVIATDLPGVLELIEPEASGLVFPIDDATALAKHVERLAHEPDLAARLAEAARARLRALDLGWDVTGRRYAELYAAVLDGHRVAR